MAVVRKKIVLLLFGAVVCLWASVSAQVKTLKDYTRDMELKWREGRLELSMTYPEVFTQRLRKRLSNGFPSRIFIYVQLVEHKKRTPLAQTVVQHTIIFKPWEERFFIRSEGPTGRRDFQLVSMQELIRTCGALDKLPLTRLVKLPSGTTCWLRVRIVVNPMSAELRKKVREYLSNPDGSSHIGSPRSFFGSFSRIFVDEKAFQADAVHRYKSPEKALPVERGSD